jgi:8-oxo-dGTP diphosphatase
MEGDGGRLYPPYPRVGVAAVVFRGNSLLLVRRREPPLAGGLSLPGGVVELGEPLDAAVVREVREETGWTVEVARMVALVDHIDRDDAGRVRYHYVLADYLCRYVFGELTAGSDAIQAELVPLDSLAGLGLPRRMLDVIRAAWRIHTDSENASIGR